MKYDDILKLEERTADNLYDIIFVKENNGWIRAHEWSAYLCDLIQDKLDIKSKLNILKKSYKPVEDGFVMNGLKLSSFEKYFKNIIAFNKLDNFDEDGYVVFNTKEFFGNDVDFNINTYKDILIEWKNKFKYTKEIKNEIIKDKDVDITSKKILMDILSYPLEKRTPIDNIEFIRRIKDEVLNIL